MINEGDYVGAQGTFDRALNIARRESDLALKVRTLNANANSDFHHLRWQESLEKNKRAVELTERSDMTDTSASTTRQPETLHDSARGIARNCLPCNSPGLFSEHFIGLYFQYRLDLYDQPQAIVYTWRSRAVPTGTWLLFHVLPSSLLV